MTASAHDQKDAVLHEDLLRSERCEQRRPRRGVASPRPRIADRSRRRRTAAALPRSSAARGRPARSPPARSRAPAQTAPASRPPASSSAFSATTIIENMAAARYPTAPSSASSRLPLEHVAKQHRGEPDRAEQQPQAAERLERREIRVLDAMKLRQPFGRTGRVGAEVAPAHRRARAATAAACSRRRFDEQAPIALLLGKQRAGSWPVTSAARPERYCRAARPRAAGGCRGPARDHDVVAELLVQHVGHRVRVGNDRDRRRPPRVAVRSSHGFARSSSLEAQRRLKRETPSAEERIRGARMRGFLGS